jgi:hypothetical protein
MKGGRKDRGQVEQEERFQTIHLFNLLVLWCIAMATFLRNNAQKFSRAQIGFLDLLSALHSNS